MTMWASQSCQIGGRVGGVERVMLTRKQEPPPEVLFAVSAHPSSDRFAACHSSVALMAFSPPIVPPARLAKGRLEVSLKGRRVAELGGAPVPTKRAPLSP